MPDISMCKGGECSLKENCYRYLAKPSEYLQSYLSNPPYDEEKKECEYYWDNKLYNQIKDDEENRH